MSRLLPDHHAPRRTPALSRVALVLAAFVAASGPPGAAGTHLNAQAAARAQADANVLVSPSRFQDLKWRNVGPHRGGRVTAVSGVRTQPNVFYMGATGGGVWKTDDYGITWTPISDGQIATGSIGAIAVADSDPNVVYVGTGSQAIRSNVIIGRGMYKSTDAGKTWQFVGLKDVGQIGSVRVNPKNPDIAFAAALGSPFGHGPNRGVYRTRDGGKTWDKVLFVNDETGAVSLAMNWSNPDEIYASAWRAQRKGWTIISGGSADTGGIYKSVDGGDHWTHLSAGLPQKLIGKVWLDIAQSKPSLVYAMIEAPGPEGGLYRSEDSGAHWTLVSNDQRLRARPFYFDYVYVNPRHEDEVWVNELRLHRSTDGGKSWTAIETPHGDNQGMWFNPDNPDILIECNDGGANVSQNGGKTWSSILNQSTAELYMVDTDQQFPYRLYAPQQDNSTVVVSSLPPFFWPSDAPTQTWFQASGCESGQIRPRPDGKVIYGDCKGEFGRYNVETGQEQHYWINPQQRYGLNPKDQTYRFVRQAPIELDPHNPGVVYHGSQYVHKTTDEGLHWTRISPDVTANEPDKQTDSGEPITRDMTGEEVYSALYSMRASRLEPGVLWTGSNDGPVWVTRDGGKTWKNVTPKDLPPGGRVHTIEDSPHRRGSAYVSVYRIYQDDYKPYLYMTNDYGATWTLLTDGTNGIPADQPMHVVREDPQVPGLLYAGTWYGAFVSFDQGKHWQPLQQNLPATPVTDIKVHDDDLVISTMGRGFWIMDDITPLRQLASKLATPATDGKGATLFAPAAAYRMHYIPQSGDPDKPEYPLPGVRIDYDLGDAPAADVKLEIVDAAGHVVRTFTGDAPRREGQGQAPAGRRRGGGATTLSKKPGMNRFVWDLRYAGSWEPNAPEGGPGGPLAAPGTYTARLTVAGVAQTQRFVIKIDPRVQKDGVTPADLTAQLEFSLKVRDGLSEANKLADRLKKALDAKSGDEAALRKLYDQLVNKPGPYTENMLIAQIQNIAREIGQADQRVGASAIERYGEVMKTLASLKSEVDKAVPAPIGG
jgi:photosystem II stability/assembly factor-like uncharacterized protein